MTEANKTHVECQHCGCSSFSELVIEWTRQDGVNIERSTGNINYEARCTKYKLVEGGLIEATD